MAGRIPLSPCRKVTSVNKLSPIRVLADQSLSLLSCRMLWRRDAIGGMVSADTTLAVRRFAAPRWIIRAGTAHDDWVGRCPCSGYLSEHRQSLAYAVPKSPRTTTAPGGNVLRRFAVSLRLPTIGSIRADFAHAGPSWTYIIPIDIVEVSCGTSTT